MARIARYALWGIFSLEEEVGSEEGDETQRGDDMDGNSFLNCSPGRSLCCWGDFIGAQGIAGLT